MEFQQLDLNFKFMSESSCNVIISIVSEVFETVLNIFDQMLTFFVEAKLSIRARVNLCMY